jgi:hypothetical protein
MDHGGRIEGEQTSLATSGAAPSAAPGAEAVTVDKNSAIAATSWPRSAKDFLLPNGPSACSR